MSEKTKNILKKVGGWFAFIVIVGLLTASPMIYLRLKTGDWNGRHAVCGTESLGNRNTDLQQIALNSDYWNFQPVAVSGKLLYSPSQETFYLRDGIFSIPLDTSDCQNLHVLENGENQVAVKGTIAKDGAVALLIVSDLRETVPMWLQIAYSGGIWGGIIFLFIVWINILMLFRRLLVRIGIIKPKVAPAPENINEQNAARMLKLGIIALFVWVINPIFGAGLQIYSLIACRDSLQSQKRKTAIAGVILCVVGLIVMPLESIMFGRLEKPYLNFYAGTFSPLAENIKPTGEEPLELKPYINNEGYFSIHLPKGWIPDESQKGGIVFNGPKIDTVDGKPVAAQIAISAAPTLGLNAEDFAKEFIKEVTQANKNFAVVKEGSRVLAGGRIDAYFLEATDKEKSVDMQGLAVFIAKNNAMYIAGANMSVSNWNIYKKVVEDSLRTLEVWDAAFAACLKSKGAVFYGILLCEACSWQREQFTDSIERLPYVECNTLNNKSQLDVCRNKNINSYPTWEFADDSRLVGGQDLKTLSEKTGCPLP